MTGKILLSVYVIPKLLPTAPRTQRRMEWLKISGAEQMNTWGAKVINHGWKMTQPLILLLFFLQLLLLSTESGSKTELVACTVNM